jgi:hypothetical protein
MKERSLSAWLILGVFLIVPALALSQGAQEPRTLIVNGQPGQVTVLQINGRSYVDLEALARVANGSLGFKGNQITLTLPGAAAAAAPEAAPAADTTNPPANPGFSKDFMTAGIEFMSTIREWRSALANAIQNGYPVTADSLASYRGQAATSLRLANVAVSTDTDRNAFQLLTFEFNNMQKMSGKYVAARQNMNYTAPDALSNDPLDQKILACARSLSSMAASGQFVDDGSCH